MIRDRHSPFDRRHESLRVGLYLLDLGAFRHIGRLLSFPRFPHQNIIPRDCREPDGLDGVSTVRSLGRRVICNQEAKMINLSHNESFARVHSFGPDKVGRRFRRFGEAHSRTVLTFFLPLLIVCVQACSDGRENEDQEQANPATEDVTAIEPEDILWMVNEMAWTEPFPLTTASQRQRMLAILQRDLPGVFPEYEKALKSARSEFERKDVVESLGSQLDVRLTAELDSLKQVILSDIEPVRISEYDFNRKGYCLGNPVGMGALGKGIMSAQGIGIRHDWVRKWDLRLHGWEADCEFGRSKGVFLSMSEDDARIQDLHNAYPIKIGNTRSRIVLRLQIFYRLTGLQRDGIHADLLAYRLVQMHHDPVHGTFRPGNPVTELEYCGVLKGIPHHHPD